jgi:hypothetical protein
LLPLKGRRDYTTYCDRSDLVLDNFLLADHPPKQQQNQLKEKAPLGWL